MLARQGCSWQRKIKTAISCRVFLKEFRWLSLDTGNTVRFETALLPELMTVFILHDLQENSNIYFRISGRNFTENIAIADFV